MALAACGGSSGHGDGRTAADEPAPPGRSAPSDVVEPGTHGVGSRVVTLVDASRPTAAHGGRPELPERTLPTLVLYPAEVGGRARPAVPEATSLPGPWPTIVFSHGSAGDGDNYIDKLATWVSAGYVVLAPSFPLSATGTAGGTRYDDVEAQAGDVSFVLDQATDPDGPFGALVDGERIGVGGQSFGAITSLAVGYNACCADPRIDAVTVFAGMWFPLSSGGAVADGARAPLLSVHGDADPTVPYDGGRAAWELVTAPKLFLTLPGGGHDDGYFGAFATPVDAATTQVTLAFYDRHLKDDDAALDRARGAVVEAGDQVARLDEAPEPP